MSDVERALSGKINWLLDEDPVVAILGARQTGKTSLSRAIRPGWAYFDFENPDDYDRISRDPAFFFKEQPSGLIIDEAQEFPELFRTLRGVIDAERSQTNRFLITGSSSEQLITGLSDSLAGRIGIVELGTLKATEIYSRPLSLFYRIFEEKLHSGQIDFLKDLPNELSHQQLKQAFLSGGYPDPVLRRSDDFWKSWMDGYFRTYLERDVRALFPRLDLVKFRRFVLLLSSLNGQLINKPQRCIKICS